MPRVTVQMQGLRELDEALGEFSKATAKGVLRRVGSQALQPFDEEWRRNAPRDTGELKDSGGVGTKLTRRQARLNKKAEGKFFVEVYAGAGGLAQATQQEFGNVNQEAQPFMRPAWDMMKFKVLDLVAKLLGIEIAKTAARLARKAARDAAKLRS